jgi:hypothetical protein
VQKHYPIFVRPPLLKRHPEAKFAAYYANDELRAIMAVSEEICGTPPAPGSDLGQKCAFDGWNNSLLTALAGCRLR